MKKLIEFIKTLFKRKPKPIVLTPVSGAWIKSHMYESGKERE